MGGGITLLSILSVFLPYNILVPIHGIVQFVSNISRTFYLRENIIKSFIYPFILGAPLGMFLAYQVIKEVTNTNYYYSILSIFIIYTVFKPKKLPTIKLNKFGWFFLGAASGFTGSLVGATGPLIAIFYVRDDISKEEIIATKAFQQSFIHFCKIPLFLSLSFNYFEYKEIIFLLCLSALFGTYVGINFLKRVHKDTFKILFKLVLLLSAFRLIYKVLI